MKPLRISMAILCLLVAGCGIANEKIDPEEMYVKAAELKKLSAAVESAVQYKEPPTALENDALLKFATSHNPALLEGFQRYLLKAKNINRHALVLMCDASGKRALLEDSGCTGKMDVHHWKSEAQVPCEYSIKVDEVCR